MNYVCKSFLALYLVSIISFLLWISWFKSSKYLVDSNFVWICDRKNPKSGFPELENVKSFTRTNISKTDFTRIYPSYPWHFPTLWVSFYSSFVQRCRWDEEKICIPKENVKNNHKRKEAEENQSVRDKDDVEQGPVLPEKRPQNTTSKQLLPNGLLV